MRDLQSIKMIAVAMAAAISGFAAVVLLVRRTSRRDQSVLLAGFLGLYALHFINTLIDMTGGYRAVPAATVFFPPVKYVFGAAFYFYARAMTSPTPQWLKRRDAWALVAPITLELSILPFIFMSDGDKVALMTGDFSSEAQRDWYMFMCRFLFVLFLASAIPYLIASMRLLVRHTRRLRDLFSRIDDKSLSWLRVTVLALAVGWTWYAVAGLWAIHGGRPSWVGTATAYFDLVWIGVIAYCGVSQAPVFEERAAGSTSSPKYAHSSLDTKRMVRITEKLERAMTGGKLFADSVLSLRTLSEQVGVSEYYVSQTLNEHLGCNFFEFVNGHRIEEAQRQLTATTEPIATIAHRVGFLSRSTFNAAFKKRVGMTPSAYRRSSRETSAAPVSSPS